MELLVVCVLLSVTFIVGYLWKKSRHLYFEETPIFIATDKKSCIGAVNKLLSYNTKYIGFDCEWKSGRNHKISLIQIGHEKLIILIRIHLFSESIPIELISFLGDVNIIKCGVGIYGDVKKLKNNYNIDIHGVVDLNAINTTSDYYGLERFSNNLLNKQMKYKHIVNHSKWENDILNPTQIYYASDDALVAYKIFKHIIQTQYDSENVLEICFGKIDTNLKGSKRQCKIKIKTKTKSNNTPINTNNVYLNENIKLLSSNDEFLTILPIKLAKQYVKKNWAKQMDSNTLKMLLPIKQININNDDLINFQRVITTMDYICMVCGDNDPEHLMWFFLVFRYLYKDIYPKSSDDPYKVLICKQCNKHAVKWIHEYQDKIFPILLCDKPRFKEIHSLLRTREMCYKLKHKTKLVKYTLEEQNEFVQQILKYCNIDERLRQCIVIKECHFNPELGIDWRYNNDYNYMTIRDCIEKVCAERLQKKVETNNWISNEVFKIFKNRKIEFCEMWRKDFMKQMKPKYYNEKYPAFEFYIGKKSANAVEKLCKHKIMDKNGSILTRTCIKFSNRILSDYDENIVIRIRNKQIGLLQDIRTIDYDCDYKTDSRQTIVWIPFKGVCCFCCNNLELLTIYNVFPKNFYDELFGNEDNYHMQFYVPLCVGCELKAKRMQNEFELRLYFDMYFKHDAMQLDEQNDVFSYAMKLSQKSERYQISIEEQNQYVVNILGYFNIDEVEGIIIKECHCNKEMDVDWYYVDQYEYVLIRECIEKLISLNIDCYREKLLQKFESNKLRFIQMWIDNFVKHSNKTHVTCFQI